MMISLIWVGTIYNNHEVMYKTDILQIFLGPISCLVGLFYGHSGIVFSVVAWFIPIIVFSCLMIKQKGDIFVIIKALGWIFLVLYWIGIRVLDVLNNV